MSWGYGPRWDHGKEHQLKPNAHNRQGSEFQGFAPRDYRDQEESKLLEERRKFDQRRGYPQLIKPYANRINDRFYRHNQVRRTDRRN